MTNQDQNTATTEPTTNQKPSSDVSFLLQILEEQSKLMTELNDRQQRLDNVMKQVCNVLQKEGLLLTTDNNIGLRVNLSSTPFETNPELARACLIEGKPGKVLIMYLDEENELVTDTKLPILQEQVLNAALIKENKDGGHEVDTWWYFQFVHPASQTQEVATDTEETSMQTEE